jgi:hypothetical protein
MAADAGPYAASDDPALTRSTAFRTSSPMLSITLDDTATRLAGVDGLRLPASGYAIRETAVANPKSKI